jgi:type VI secretion system peptidoglycan-associated protein
MPAETSAKPENDIFISYSGEDVCRVEPLVAALEVEGWKVFWDQEISPGEDWESYIGTHLDSVPVVIAVWSKHSIVSRYVRAEANRANKRNALIPVKIDAVEPPFGFEHIQSANLLEWLAKGGGTLPARLKSSILRKISINTTIGPPAPRAATLPPPPSSSDSDRSGVGDIDLDPEPTEERPAPDVNSLPPSPTPREIERKGISRLPWTSQVIDAVAARRHNLAEADLTLDTKGVSAPPGPARVRVLQWVAATGGLSLAAGLFAWCLIDANAASDTTYTYLQGAQPDHMPIIIRAPLIEAQPVVATLPSGPPEPTTLDKLRQFLKPEIDQSLIEILGTPAQPLIRIIGKGMFASGSATLEPGFKPLLDRIGLALKEENGPVKVIGYTDDQPFRSIAFPSNFQLSAARAQAALTILAAVIGDASRLVAEGRADADPIALNTTPEGRERNRRIEIVLTRREH